MAEGHVRRKLTTILAADVEGYSRLMGADEEATLATLRSYRDVVGGLIAGHDGRLVGTAGDAVLAEFGSAVEAVRCAMSIQEELAARNAAIADDRRMRFRIGINVGDVMVEGDDLLGDGVNVAARLEGLAEPGGICISASAYDQVRNKLPAGFEDLGPRELKNIAEPVHVYRVLPGAGTGTASPRQPRPKRRAAAAALLLLVAAVAVGAVGWWRTRPPAPSPAATAEPAPARAKKASIAVLPFVNMSGDKEQQYFSDGMTEDLITDLSKISDLSVISRTSTSGYKGRKIDVREIGKALDVRYVIEGSVRKAGERVRINAQLIDTATGGHLWAQRYDGNLKDIFSLQDQVVEKIVGSLALKLSGMDRQRIAARGTDSIAAHDLYLRGLYQESVFTRKGNQLAMRLYEQALAIDPGYPLPYARMANILELNARNGWSEDVQADLRKAVALAEKAIALDPRNPYLHWSLGRSVARLKSPDALKRGIASLERAIELDPNFADAYAFLTVLYIGDGRARDGLRSVETAMRLNPRYPFWYLFMRGMTRYFVEDYDSAIADFKAAADRSPTAQFVRWWLAAAYAQAGRQDDAEWQVEELKGLGFKGTIGTILETGHMHDPKYRALEIEGLRKAGIPQ